MEANNADRQMEDNNAQLESAAVNMDSVELHRNTVDRLLVALVFFVPQSMALQRDLLPVGTESMLVQAMQELESNAT